jgi:solute:Na+ symporter, SSS family
MNAYGQWVIGLAVAYTALLIATGRIARRKAQAGAGGYFVGGRQFSPLLVACCVTGLFSGSTFIAVLELSYLKGISAAWYGVAETIQVVLIALFLVTPFRERALVTISGLIGDHYGRAARGIAGAITAFAFPMWSVATALAFASAVHVATGIPLLWSLVLTAVLLLAYLQGGGMWSIGLTQSINCVVFAVMLVIGLIAVVAGDGFAALARLAAARPEYYAADSVGMTQIAAWFGTFIINVPLAQATFQMAVSCRTPEEGRLGLYWACLMGIPFIAVATLLGLTAAAALPGGAQGLIVIPHYMESVLPAPLVGVFFLGIWACALGWGGPCQFSGATSLGRDVMTAVRPGSSEADLVRYTRWALVLLTVLMVVFGVLRSEQSAWWNILAWTARNSATFAPVITALLWPGATRPAALAAMIVGFASGMLWYQLSGWGVAHFLYGIHPVWLGMSTNIIVLVLLSLATRGGWRFARGGVGYAGIALIAAGAGLAALVIEAFAALQPSGLLGLVLFLAALAFSLGVMAAIRPREESGGATTLAHVARGAAAAGD